MDLVLEQKAKSTMNKRKIGQRDLDRLYMTQSDYKKHIKLRNSVIDQRNTFEYNTDMTNQLRLS